MVGLAVIDGDARITRTCSATVIAPNLVLTAQHCIARTPRYVHCDRSAFGPPEPAGRVFVTQSQNLWDSDAAWIPVAEVLAPPGDDMLCGRDVALLLLGEGIPGPARELAPRLDEMPEPGDVYSAIGFGTSGQGEKDGGQRRRRDRLQIVCVGEACGGKKQVKGSEWRGDHGICNGDSGGPAIDSEGRVIGVTSRGPNSCDDPIYGGLAGHKEWIRGEAVRAARAGRYAPAAWVREGAVAPGDDASAQRAWSSCAAAPLGHGSAGGALLLLAGVTAIAIARRHESGAHGSV